MVELEKVRLSAREFEVFLLRGLGLRNEQIANRLYISKDTVKTYISTVLHKLDCPRDVNEGIRRISLVNIIPPINIDSLKVVELVLVEELRLITSIYDSLKKLKSRS